MRSLQSSMNSAAPSSRSRAASRWRRRTCFLSSPSSATAVTRYLIETGGFVSTEEVDPRATIILDVKCPASGEAERNHWPNLERLRREKDEVKFVVADLADWEFART